MHSLAPLHAEDVLELEIAVRLKTLNRSVCAIDGPRIA
jgi:hypothetical protein